MSVWSNHEYFDHLPDRDPTAPLESPWDDDTDIDEPTEADIEEMLRESPMALPPTDDELEAMAAFFAEHWRDPPF